ncbi:sugar ABC transporter substrate-binding protein [Microbacterium sp. GXF7504]
MMMNRTRNRAVAAAAIAVGTLTLGACSGGGSGDSSADGEDVVTVWHYFTDDQQVKLVEEYKTLFEASHEGATVENVYVPYDQLNSKLISAAGAGQGPDVVVFNGADASTLALAGALAPLDEYWDGYEDAGQFSDAAIHEVEGTTYAVQGYVNVLGLWYNADLLAEIGVEVPTTMDELEAAMAASVAAGHGGITLSGLPNSQGEWQGYPWLSASGFDYDDLDQDAFQAGLERIAGWVDEGWLPQEAVNWDQTVPFQQFAAGDYAFAANGNWQQGTAAAEAGFEYGVTALPLGADGQVYLGGEGEAIGAFSDNPDLAWEYLKTTYYSAEGQLLAPEIVGSLPTRTDAAADEVVTSNALLAPFAETIELYGAAYPSAAVPADAVADLQLTVGQAWSSVIGRQSSPADAAASAIATLTGLLGR